MEKSLARNAVAVVDITDNVDHRHGLITARIPSLIDEGDAGRGHIHTKDLVVLTMFFCLVIHFLFNFNSWIIRPRIAESGECYYLVHIDSPVLRLAVEMVDGIAQFR